MLRKWDKASQMRKWTSSVKIIISERTEKEELDKYIAEYNKANPSKEPLKSGLSQEHRDIV
jgi:hypothetical protein